jgi:hypothetical protein
MNGQQKNYLLAKAYLEALEGELAEEERRFITEYHIKNCDGTIPERIYMIEDNEVFDKANEKFSAWRVREGKEKEMMDARTLLKEAEKNLLEYALSLSLSLPTSAKSVLESAAEKDYCVRQKIIDLALRLDTSTV